MTEGSDLFLMTLILAGWVFHHGGLEGAWEALVGRFSEMCQEAWDDIAKRLEDKDKWSKD